MPSILENPAFHYGVPILNAGIIVVIALTLLSGTVKWAALGVAAVEAIAVPQVLKRAAE